MIKGILRGQLKMNVLLIYLIVFCATWGGANTFSDKMLQ